MTIVPIKHAIDAQQEPPPVSQQILESVPNPSQQAVHQVRDAVAQLRRDVAALVDEPLDALRQFRVELQGKLASLKEEMESRVDVADQPTVKDEGILGAVAWMDDGSQVPFERTLRLADEILDEKDAEISRLRQQLEQLQHANSCEAEEVHLDIEEERAKLKQLQDEWRDKMRRAEVEFSLERAKLTREHEQLTEKLCRLESELERATPGQRDGGGRKWLRQLGLSDTRE